MRVLLELGLFIIVLAAANFIARLVFPDPFAVQLGHTYSGEEAQKLIDADNRQAWVFWPIVIVVYVSISVWKNRGPYYRGGDAGAT